MLNSRTGDNMRRIFSIAAALVLLCGCARNSSRQSVAQIDEHQAQGPRTPTPESAPSAAQPASSADAASQGANPSGASPISTQSDVALAKSSPISPGAGGGTAAQATPSVASPVIIPAGQRLRVRLEQTIDTKRNRPGDRFQASLVTPLVIDGQTLVPKGTLFSGHVTEAKPSGRLKGRAILGIELDSFAINGVTYSIVTSADTRVSGRHRKRNWLLIGGGSGLGTTIGAIAGGPAGALIGAGAGAAAGTTGAFFTGRKNVAIPVETVLSFALRREIRVQQPQTAESQR
jgi:hypothetical protein